MSLIATGLLATHKYNADRQVLEALAATAGSLPIRELVQRFVSYNGFLFPDLKRLVVEEIREACRRNSLANPATAVTDAGRVGDELVASLGLQRIAYFAEGPQPNATARLLEPCPNVHRSGELPFPISRRLAQPTCPALDFYGITGATLYVGPADFELFDAQRGCFVPGATVRPHSRTILSSPVLMIDRPVVLIQDMFNGYNFAHFLLDWLVRLALFTDRGPIRASECMFVFGGLPREFHRIVLDAARSILRLEAENFFFPTTDVLLQSTSMIGFFSGQCDDSGHPAQLCRAEAMNWLQRLAHAVSGKPSPARRRVYVSRGDAGYRAVANERELFGVLSRHGFELVRLGDLPVADQFSVMLSAEIVVGAHGMGLTYLGLNTAERATLIELHHPMEGTDTYAFLAKGKGFEYRAVIGDAPEGARNFRIQASEVERALGCAPAPLAAQPAASTEVMNPRSGMWHSGCQLTPATVTSEIEPPEAGDAVLKHVRSANAVEDSNVGWWQLDGLRALETCTVSCFVFLPESFTGDRVILSVAEPSGRIAEARLSGRGEWQEVSVTLTLPSGVPTFNAVLRVFSTAESAVYSSAWRLERRSPATTNAAVTGTSPDNLAGSLARVREGPVSLAAPVRPPVL
jgi:hypothetical protein